MIQPARIATAAGEVSLRELGAPLPLDRLVDAAAPETGDRPWEVEVGFGKGRHLLARATAEPERRFLGIEIATEYWAHVADRLRRRGIHNLVVIRGEAQFLLATALPAAFAEVVHVYFPDPWPKTRHQKRRLFDPESLDLLLRILRPGGRIEFATDFLEYGALVHALLASHPSLSVAEVGPWPGGPRTHYEAKYLVEGRPILRLVATFSGAVAPHPDGERALAVGPRPPATAEPVAAPAPA